MKYFHGIKSFLVIWKNIMYYEMISNFIYLNAVQIFSVFSIMTS